MPKEENREKNILETFCTDLTKLATMGDANHIICREEEIALTIQVLSRRRKNNPLLIGHLGIGKKSIVKGIAQKIALNSNQQNIGWKRVLSLDTTLLFSVAKTTQDLNQILKSIMESIYETHEKSILFIDEIHKIIGIGNDIDSRHSANTFKSTILRGQIRCIGSTTSDLFGRYISKDDLFERHFQTIYLKEPSLENTKQIIKSIKNKYEVFHGVEITDSAIDAAIKMSDKYIHDKPFPYKAINVIDEASSIVKINISRTPLEIEQKNSELLDLLSSQDFKKTSDMNLEIKKKQEDLEKLQEQCSIEKTLIKKLNILKKELLEFISQENNSQKTNDIKSVSQIRYEKIPLIKKEIFKTTQDLNSLSKRFFKESVDEHVVASVISSISGISIEKILQKEEEILLSLEQKIAEKFVGQNDAVSELCNVIRRSKAGLEISNKPSGTFLFFGPHGVGKTELAKVLSKQLFGDRNYICSIDMENYTEKHSIYKLIGYYNGNVEIHGQLTLAIENNPNSIILFEDIDKANPNILNFLIQMLHEGKITNCIGRTTPIKNCIFIMTSNFASKEIIEACKNKNSMLLNKEAIFSIVIKSVKTLFSPQFINNVEILTFFPLSKADIKQITRFKFENLKEKLLHKGILLEFSENTIQSISDESFNFEFGARLINPTFKRKIENILAIAILEGKIQRGDKVRLEAKGDANIIYHINKNINSGSE